MTAQRYFQQLAFTRMAHNLCPECGHEVEDHTGWGCGLCSCLLTDNGVFQRIAQYKMDQENDGR